MQRATNHRLQRPEARRKMRYENDAGVKQQEKVNVQIVEDEDTEQLLDSILVSSQSGISEQRVDAQSKENQNAVLLSVVSNCFILFFIPFILFSNCFALRAVNQTLLF